MGTLTLAQMRAQVLLKLDSRKDVNDSDLNIWLNMAYDHMTHPSIHEFEELSVKDTITLVVNTETYDLSSVILGHRMIAIRSVHYVHSSTESLTARRHRLKPRAIQQYDNRMPTASEPRYYYMGESDDIVIDPYPNAGAAGNIIVVRYWREPTHLAAAGDVSVLPNYYDQLLILGCLYQAEETLNYRDRAEETKQNYVNLLNDASEKAEIEGYDWEHKTEVRLQPSMVTT